MKRVLVATLVVACQDKRPAPPPPTAEAAVTIDAVVDAPIDARVVAPPDAVDPEMQRVLASSPCCCALASTEPEYETQPRLLCQEDTHGTCVAASKCPAPGSVDAQIATWWHEAGNGDPKLHAADSFVVEAKVDPAVFYGQTCGNPYVVDTPNPKDECLRLAVVNHRPPKLQAGWGCQGFSKTDLANRIKAERTAAKDHLRCGNRKQAGVFVAVDASGKITAFLVNTYAPR